MPTNKLIYFGVIVIAASVLLWLGAQLAIRAEWILPYTAGVGVLMMIAGMFMEIKKKKEATNAASSLESGMTPTSASVPEKSSDSVDA